MLKESGSRGILESLDFGPLRIPIFGMVHFFNIAGHAIWIEMCIYDQIILDVAVAMYGSQSLQSTRTEAVRPLFCSIYCQLVSDGSERLKHQNMAQMWCKRVNGWCERRVCTRSSRYRKPRWGPWTKAWRFITTTTKFSTLPPDLWLSRLSRLSASYPSQVDNDQVSTALMLSLAWNIKALRDLSHWWCNKRGVSASGFSLPS